MKFIKLSDTCYYFQGAVNIGYVHQGNFGLLIDAGLDTSTMKKVVRQLEKETLPISHLFITHAHADHFGGAAYLQQNYHVHTMAPELEEAIMRHPILEPIYLFQGNSPLQEMRNKFLEGPPINISQIVKEGKIDVDGLTMEFISLPGHSENQLGVLIDKILYCGDAYFGIEQLRKHKIPFNVDVETTINSLEKLKLIQCDGAVPGHGVFEEEFYHTLEQNVIYHDEVLNTIKELLNKTAEGISHEAMVREICMKYQVSLPHLSAWMLYRTAVTAYVTKLVKEGTASFTINNFTLWIEKAEGEG